MLRDELLRLQLSLSRLQLLHDGIFLLRFDALLLRRLVLRIVLNLLEHLDVLLELIPHFLCFSLGRIDIRN